MLCSLRYVLSSGIPISWKWKMLAASPASALPLVKTSRKCSMVPAPPEAMTGIESSVLSLARASQAKPCLQPSWFMLVKRISPAPRSWAS